MSGSSINFEAVHLHYSSLAFRDRSLVNWLASTVRSPRVIRKTEDIHALDGVSLRIDSGERVGLLGRNGAGKSTLLKATAGLYPISRGQLTVNGEVRSLFNLGLGFEPDATGRENILYRGLLMGKTPSQMRGLEAGIIEFADIGEFIDYPIKTYSAGMQVRLAFAISTAISGDILLLDEVIGAGDATFMKRAKARIKDLVNESEIVVVASHDSGSLRQICTRGIVLHQGQIRFDGEIGKAIDHYAQVEQVQS